MEKYTILCTQEQTRKALKLGAPIKLVKVGEGRPLHYLCSKEYKGYYVIPTAEQMLGWLEANGFYFRLESFGGSVEIDDICIYEEHRVFRKEATLAAIDAALEYLSNNQKK